MGSVKVPAGLRSFGVDLVTLSERYGVVEGERIEDVVWMADAAAAGDAVLMCDDAIRKKNPEERRVLVACELRAFVVNAQIPAIETVRRFETLLPAIAMACRQPGPYVYRLHPAKLTPLPLRR